MRQIAIELVVSALYGLPNLLDHAELIYTFRLGARVPHRLLDHTISRHLAHSRAKGVPQLINGEVRYARPPECILPGGFDTANRHVLVLRARKEIRALKPVLLPFPPA